MKPNVDAGESARSDVLAHATPISLAKGEAEDFGAAVEELDLKPPVRDRSRLTDQLIHPLLHNRDIPIGVDISSMGRRGALSVEGHTKRHGRALSHRPLHEVHVGRLELVRAWPVRGVE